MMCLDKEFAYTLKWDEYPEQQLSMLWLCTNNRRLRVGSLSISETAHYQDVKRAYQLENLANILSNAHHNMNFVRSYADNKTSVEKYVKEQISYLLSST